MEKRGRMVWSLRPCLLFNCVVPESIQGLFHSSTEKSPFYARKTVLLSAATYPTFTPTTYRDELRPTWAGVEKKGTRKSRLCICMFYQTPPHCSVLNRNRNREYREKELGSATKALCKLIESPSSSYFYLNSTL